MGQCLKTITRAISEEWKKQKPSSRENERMGKKSENIENYFEELGNK